MIKNLYLSTGFSPIFTILFTTIVTKRRSLLLARTARKLSSTGIYHIVIRGADRQSIFINSNDYLKYIDLLRFYTEECSFDIYAYALMSNHIHLLIQTNSTSLETVFRRLNTAYAGWFNMKYNRTGFLQQGRFYSEPVENTAYLLTVIRYIHQNPTKAGLESFPGELYKWTSYDEIINNSSTMINTKFILDIFGGVEFFQKYNTANCSDNCLDIENMRRRLPDDVAFSIMIETCNCSCPSDFQKLSMIEQRKSISLLHEKGISVRQLNRITGISKKVIEKAIENKI